jgi:hypothetical protein
MTEIFKASQRAEDRGQRTDHSKKLKLKRAKAETLKSWNAENGGRRTDDR